VLYLALFGREVQVGDSGWAHIPSTDNDSWLCANLHGHVKASSTMKKMKTAVVKNSSSNSSATNTMSNKMDGNDAGSSKECENISNVI
jgi:hypothetical protein